MLKKILLSLATLLSLSEAQLLGSSKDSHECVTDGGYSWCPTLGRCVREWETPCNKNMHIVPPPPAPPPPPPASIPENCNQWYDGCNRCFVKGGNVLGCSRMFCREKKDPHCLHYNKQVSTLQENDVCYRFCENDASNNMNRKNDCPKNTKCVSHNNMVSFDSCNGRAYRCLSGGH